MNKMAASGSHYKPINALFVIAFLGVITVLTSASTTTAATTLECPNCQRCSSNQTCITCKEGFFKETDGACTECQKPCQTCISLTECDVCEPGSFGSNCNYRCIANCSICNDTSTCIKCKDGNFGDDCSLECRRECASCINFDDCNFECKDRSYGKACQFNCPDGCQTCDSSTNCITCRTDYRQSPSSSACDCTKKNSTLCLDPKWYKTTDSWCCKCGEHCTNQTCNSSGHCIDGCDSGYYGDHCNLPCISNDANCVQCPGSGVGNFTCTTCVDGMYPDVNTKVCVPCNDMCTDSSNATAKCDSSSGACRFGCQGNYIGQRCQLLCHKDCFNCSVIQERAVCQICKDGFYVDTQNDTTCVECSRNCLTGASDVTTGPICNQINGACLLGCSHGFYGERCDMTCGQNCLNGTCDRDGRCHNGCITGRFGSMCDMTCGQNCLNGTCDQEGGCLNGCVTGRFGLTCDDTCSLGCLNAVCNKESGECTSGCKDDFTGKTCDPIKPPEDSSFPGYLIGVIVAAVVVCAVVVGVIVYCVRRGRSISKDVHGDHCKGACDHPENKRHAPFALSANGESTKKDHPAFWNMSAETL